MNVTANARPKADLDVRRTPGPLRLRSRVWWISASYAVFATLWIYFSDRALRALVSDPHLLLEVSTYKGVLFVGVTTLLLFLLIRRAFHTIDRNYRAMRVQAAEIRRLNRLYAALSQVNQAIVTTTARDELFAKTCRVLVEYGGFRMAWIGLHDAGTRQLLPVAEFGDENGHLHSFAIYGDDRPGGHGPAGRAFREAQPMVSNDFLNDAAAAPWQGEASRREIRAVAAFPIRCDTAVIGVLTVYAHEVGFFQEAEIALLNEAATEVSFALDNFVRSEERRQAEALADAERLFSDRMIESLPGIAYFYDRNGGFLRWNHNFEIVSGYAPEEIARMHPRDFFPPQERPLLEARIADVFRRGEASIEAAFLSKDGRTTPYSLSGRRVTYQGQPCLVGMGIDISARREAEQAIRDLNASLELRVAERTAELEQALIRAEAADRLKSAFLATMSHELRTPLNSIIGFTGILVQELAGPLNPEQAKQLGMVQGSARHLLDLINDVLDISKIEAGQFEVRAEAFDVTASIERVMASIQPLAERKHLALVSNVPAGLPEMVNDQRRVEQVLINLLNNAVKFTNQGQVTLTVECITDHPGDVGGKPRPALRLCIEDTGIGIKHEDLAVLFQPFRQIDTGLDRQHEGTGLGLAICRRLVELLGGSIAAESTWQQGSRFTVILPLQAEPTP
ncbi:MAG: ATP-binding protein [Gammaproteobacteria bacterium]